MCQGRRQCQAYPWQAVGWHMKVKGTGCRWGCSASGPEMCWPRWSTFDVLWRQAWGSWGNRGQETPVKYLSEIRKYLSKRAAWAGSSAEVLCTSTHSVGNKQEEEEATVLLWSYNLIAITETWRDKSHDWIAPMDGYRLFQKSKGGQIALCFRRWIECKILSLKNRHEQVERLWVRIRQRQQREPHGWYVPQAAQPRGACWQSSCKRYCACRLVSARGLELWAITGWAVGSPGDASSAQRITSEARL